MSPVPEKNSGKAGTSMQKARGAMSEVAVDPTTVSEFLTLLLLALLSSNLLLLLVSRASAHNVFESELLWLWLSSFSCRSSRTEVIMTCGI